MYRSLHNTSIPEKQSSNNSFSASNSTFDFNLIKNGNDNDTAHSNSGSRGMNQFNLSANSSSNYEDDDVFSANNSFSSPSLSQQNKHNENIKWDANQNFDTAALAQLYRNILST